MRVLSLGVDRVTGSQAIVRHTNRFKPFHKRELTRLFFISRPEERTRGEALLSPAQSDTEVHLFCCYCETQHFEFGEKQTYSSSDGC